MATPPKANPDIYPVMRRNALEMQILGPRAEGVRLLLMDWIVANGTATVLAVADGTASVYLSSGGGYIGGGQRSLQISETYMICPSKARCFSNLRTDDAVHLAVGREELLRNGTETFKALGPMMQAIATGYRLSQQKSQQGPPERK